MALLPTRSAHERHAHARRECQDVENMHPMEGMRERKSMGEMKGSVPHMAAGETERPAHVPEMVHETHEPKLEPEKDE